MNKYFDTEEYKASEVYRKEHLDELINENGDIYETAINDSFVAGCDWKLKQLMKDAVDAEASYTLAVPSILLSLPIGIKVGDKVKVIIIKQ